MRSSYLRITFALIAAILFTFVVTSFGEDYLVIKKKDGTTQKVPLNFSPEDIESFKVEPSTEAGAPPAKPPTKEPEAKPLEITPRGPAPGRAPRERPGEPATPFGRPEGTKPVRPARERAEGPPPPAPGGPKALKPGKPEARPVTPPAVGGGVGRFIVNIYKLPDDIRELPDFSALRPEKIVTTDRINLQTSTGGEEPRGLPEKTAGMGLRFVGMFHVAGEGIFRWRVRSKDGIRFHIDDKTLIENDGVHGPASKSGYVHLGQGTHSILLDSFNSSGRPVLQLFAMGPAGPEHLFSIGQGLKGWKEPDKPYDVLWGQVYFVPKGKYPKGPDFRKISPIGRLIAHDLAIGGGEGFPGLPGRTDMVGIRYEGFFTVKGAGIFAFRLRADHYAKLTIGKHEIAEVTKGHRGGPEGDVGWAFFQEGAYPITLEYFHPSGEPRLELYVTEPRKDEIVFTPAQPLVGYATDSANMNMIPAFVYFVKHNTKKIPNFNKLAPSGMFFTRAIDYPVDRGSKDFPGIPRREDWLGIRFYVKFSLTDEEQGEYKFRIIADDAARLIVGKKLVINAEGREKPQEKTGAVTLGPGSHEMFLDYLQTTGPNGIQLFITAPGGEEKVFAFQ